MHHFHYQGEHLQCEQVALSHIASEVRTPCYVYSYATIRRHYTVFEQALQGTPHLICFSTKANSNGAVLASLANLGAGADIVSGGELYRALKAGIPANKIVFSGVGKQAREIEEALNHSILLFNVESEGELAEINRVARHIGKKAPIALRVNPDVDAETHPYIATGLRESKFGIPLEQAWDVYLKAIALSHVEVRGIDCHIGSQLTSVTPIVDSIEAVVQMAQRLRDKGVPLQYIDVGGGLGIRYDDESPPSPAEYGAAVRALMERFGDTGLTLLCEPGRVIMGNAGVLLTRVLYVKQHEQKHFVVVDAAMNDLLRPSLYGSHHAIWPADRADKRSQTMVADVVGPVCESGDFLAQGRQLPVVQPGDLLAVMSAGAYGFSMSSNYNSRPRAAEVMVRGHRHALIRARETYQDLVRAERVPDWVGGDHNDEDKRELDGTP